MIIKVKELCWVSYIKEEDMKKESDEKVTAVRTVIYNSPKDTLLEAFQDYDSKSFDSDNIIMANDEFQGECLDLIKYLSVEEDKEIYNGDPYSPEDYERAKMDGLDLNKWSDYVKFYELGEEESYE